MGQQVKGRLERPFGTPAPLGQSLHFAELAREKRDDQLVSLKSTNRRTKALAFSLDMLDSRFR